MYLTTKLSKGHRYLYLMESVYDPSLPGKSKVRKKHVKNLGRYDKLPEQVRKAYEDNKQKKALADAFERALLEKELDAGLKYVAQAMQSQSSSPADGSVKEGYFNRALALCYGHLALKGIWEDDLNLKYKIGYLQKTTTNIETWQINDLLFYLCSSRLIHPTSYLDACKRKASYLFCPWQHIDQDNFYRGLDFVYKHRDTLIEWAVKSHQKAAKTEVEVAFFDCTNTWFETPYDDVVWQIMRFTRQVRQDKAAEGLSEQAIGEYLESDEFAQDLAVHLETEKENVLRMRGPSKEGRYSQPIVTVALAIDQTGFPIDCRVFADNLSEMRTIKPMLESLQKKYAVKDVYFVADRGLNSTENLDTIQRANLGFVVAQKVSNQNEKQRAEMLDLKGYQNCSIDSSGEFQALASSEVRQDALRFKVCDYVKTAEVELGTGELTPKGTPRKKRIKVPCQIIYTFSPERRARDLADLNSQIARASKAIAEGKLMGNAYGSGWRSLIMTQKEAAESGQDKEQYRAIGLKQSVIEQRQTIAGYSAIVFEHPKTAASDEKLTGEQVMATYHKLVAIEDCLRVMKSSFSIRPVYVWSHDRITAHCYLCVLSLMLMRSLQEKLLSINVSMSPARLSAALANALVLPMPAADGSIKTFVNFAMFDSLYTPNRVGKGRVIREENDTLDHQQAWSDYEAERSATPHDTDLVFRAAGLTPLRFYNTLGEVKRSLGIKTQPDDVMVAEEMRQYVAKVAAQLQLAP